MHCAGAVGSAQCLVSAVLACATALINRSPCPSPPARCVSLICSTRANGWPWRATLPSAERVSLRSCCSVDRDPLPSVGRAAGVACRPLRTAHTPTPRAFTHQTPAHAPLNWRATQPSDHNPHHHAPSSSLSIPSLCSSGSCDHPIACTCALRSRQCCRDCAQGSCTRVGHDNASSLTRSRLAAPLPCSRAPGLCQPSASS